MLKRRAQGGHFAAKHEALAIPRLDFLLFLLCFFVVASLYSTLLLFSHGTTTADVTPEAIRRRS